MFLMCIVFHVDGCSDVRLFMVLEIAIAIATAQVLNVAGSPPDTKILNDARSPLDDQTYECCWKSA